MAIIGKIQKNSILLLVVIGLAMFAFIYTEYQSGAGNDYERTPIGTVYEEEIDEVEYNYILDSYTERDRQNSEMQGRNYDEDDQAQQSTKEQAFNEVIRRNLMNREFEKLQLTCTVDELNDMIHGNHIHPWVMQIPIFQGVMGFSKDSVRAFITNLDVEPENEEMRDNWLAARKQWSDFEKELKDTRKADKYVTLIKKGLYVNSLEAKDQYFAELEKKKIKFVLQRYADIPADEIVVTDEDIEAYYNEHKDEKQYEQEESRDIEYISFPILATVEDVDLVKSELEDLKAGFKTTKNNVAYVQKYSSTEFTNDSAVFHMGSEEFVFDTYFGNNQYPAAADDMIQKAQIGDVIGPFASKTDFAIAKVTGIKKENQAWVRHILIKVDATQPDNIAKARVDSIIKVITEKDNFVEMVAACTQDPGSIATNGEYKWFAEGRMVPEFNDASFKGPIGKLQTVKTTYGYHIVEVLGRGERNVPMLAIITKSVKPSEATKKMMEERVFEFIYNVNESKKDSAFHMLARDSNYVINPTRIWMNDNFVMGIKKSDRLLRFAFNKDAVEQSISDPILDEDKYVVAYLSNIIPEGTPEEFRDVKDQMRFAALKEKQAKVYMEKMGGKGSLEEVAKVVVNGAVLEAEVYFAQNMIQGGGSDEPEVIGKLFTKIPVGSMTKPIKGKTGVYVVIVESETKAPETTDYTPTRLNMLAGRAGSADSLVIKALREKADVKDNRRKIELEN